MKLFPPRSRETTEFVGRTLDEAVRRARRDLGDDARIRCWKVRRGGVMGFFAHEYFVAGLSAPAGSTGAVSDVTNPTTNAADAREVLVSGYEVDRYDAAEVDRDAGWEGFDATITPRALDDLVAATDDELALSGDDATRRAFGEVLAQAEALLMRPAPRDPATLMYARPETSPEVPPGPKETDRADLRQRLSDLGVPENYLPASGEGFDALWARLEELPSAELPRGGAGEVIAVVGSRRDTLTLAAVLVTRLALAERDVIDAAPSSELRRRVQRRRRTTRTSVVVVDAPVGSTSLDDARRWLGQLGATRVIGALGANAKRADVRRWLDELEVVDSLACGHLGPAGAVADLMGLSPICLLDAEPATALRWMALLIGALGRLEP